MLRKSHLLSRCKTNGSKNLKKSLMHFDPDSRIFVLSNCNKIQLCDKFSSIILICSTRFPQLLFGRIGRMILMKEYVCLTTTAIKMGKKHF